MNANTPSLQITPAQSLEEVYRTLQPSPLETIEELNAFYREDMNRVRGGDKMDRLELGLKRAYKDHNYFKAFFMGHQGVGKSTELSRLIERIKDKFYTIRFSALSTLDPSNFRPLDVVLMMMVDVAEQTAKPKNEGGANKKPPKERLQEIWEWFATETETREKVQDFNASLEAGAGVKEDSLWNQILGLFANLKGEIKFASTRKNEVVEHRVSRLTSLIEVANRLLDDCNDLLRKETGREWLFVGEDFDRAGISSTKIEDLFIQNASIFRDLRTHLIFNLPVSLYYSSKAPQLPFTNDRCFVLPDTPVFGQDHSPNVNGRSALRSVLEARMAINLFEKDQMERLIVASGGNLRDLFALVNYAADSATLRDAETINADDVFGAIVNLRSDYERRLGQSPYDPETVSYKDKADRLFQIYNNEKMAQITDPVMYSLLNARAIQEFNGQRWFGLHPLVVDILASQKYKIERTSTGELIGGTF
jgi:hypothetical protein